MYRILDSGADISNDTIISWKDVSHNVKHQLFEAISEYDPENSDIIIKPNIILIHQIGFRHHKRVTILVI